MASKDAEAVETFDTDKKLRSFPPANPGERYMRLHAARDGFGVMINDRGDKSFFLNIRYPGSPNPSRRVLGEYGPKTNRAAGILTLKDARALAEEWRGMVKKGQDPREEMAKERRQRAEIRANTFGVVAEAFFASLPASERKRDEVKRDVRKELVGAWKNRPITELTRADVAAVIQSIVARGASHHARNILGYARRVFDWAIVQGCYGLEQSPCDKIKPRQLVGRKTARDRVLDDEELRAYWQAAGELGYPYGPIFQLLALTGQRKSEIAEASRRELDHDEKLLQIPAARMKGSRPHAVPLSADALAIIRALPKFEAGGFLFSTTSGAKPVSGFGKAKVKLDELMTAKLGRAPAPFVIHDVRRTVRSHLSRLKISEEAREAVLAHVRPGVKGVYDKHEYLEEKREALDLWAGRLSQIVVPPKSPDDAASNILRWKMLAR